jgi:hypothetical protein
MGRILLPNLILCYMLGMRLNILRWSSPYLHIEKVLYMVYVYTHEKTSEKNIRAAGYSGLVSKGKTSQASTGLD